MIDPKFYGLIEMAATFGIVGTFVVHQLWTLRDRPPAEDDAPDAGPEE